MKVVYPILCAYYVSLEVPSLLFSDPKDKHWLCVSLFDSHKGWVFQICMLYENMYLYKLYLQSLAFPNVHHKDRSNYKA